MKKIRQNEKDFIAGVVEQFIITDFCHRITVIDLYHEAINYFKIVFILLKLNVFIACVVYYLEARLS